MAINNDTNSPFPDQSSLRTANNLYAPYEAQPSTETSGSGNASCNANTTPKRARRTPNDDSMSPVTFFQSRVGSKVVLTSPVAMYLDWILFAIMLMGGIILCIVVMGILGAISVAIIAWILGPFFKYLDQL